MSGRGAGCTAPGCLHGLGAHDALNRLQAHRRGILSFTSFASAFIAVEPDKLLRQPGHACGCSGALRAPAARRGCPSTHLATGRMALLRASLPRSGSTRSGSGWMDGCGPRGWPRAGRAIPSSRRSASSCVDCYVVAHAARARPHPPGGSGERNLRRTRTTCPGSPGARACRARDPRRGRPASRRAASARPTPPCPGVASAPR